MYFICIDDGKKITDTKKLQDQKSISPKGYKAFESAYRQFFHKKIKPQDDLPMTLLCLEYAARLGVYPPPSLMKWINNGFHYYFLNMHLPNKERLGLDQTLGLSGNKIAKGVLLEGRDWTIANDMHQLILRGISEENAAFDLMLRYKDNPETLGPQEAREMLKTRGQKPGHSEEPAISGIPESPEAFKKIYRKMKEKYPIFLSDMEIDNDLININRHK